MIQETQIKHALKTLNVDEPLANIANVRATLNMLVMSDLQEGDAENIFKMHTALFDILFDYLGKTEKICDNNVRTYLELHNLLEKEFDEVGHE